MKPACSPQNKCKQCKLCRKYQPRPKTTRARRTKPPRTFIKYKDCLPADTKWAVALPLDLSNNNIETLPELADLQQTYDSLLLSILTECMQQLTERQKQYVTMYYLQQITTTAIAAQLGLHVNTVHTGLFGKRVGRPATGAMPRLYQLVIKNEEYMAAKKLMDDLKEKIEEVNAIKTKDEIQEPEHVIAGRYVKNALAGTKPEHASTHLWYLMLYTINGGQNVDTQTAVQHMSFPFFSAHLSLAKALGLVSFDGNNHSILVCNKPL